MSHKVLVIDDDLVDLKLMERFFSTKNLTCLVAKNEQQGLQLYERHRPKIVFIDLIMPKMNGIEMMEKILSDDPQVSIVIFTGYASIETAVEAIKKGAHDYITKPINPTQLSLLIERIVKSQELVSERNTLQHKLDELFGSKNFIGHSKAIQKIVNQIEQVSKTDSTVLITGKSGTGKELCAHAIHYASKRKGKPFVKMNCAALAENIIESELFGHEKGAFTSAINRHIGRFESANGGTLFLDEIGDMPVSTQVKLLRVLESQAFERVGGRETIQVDVRLMAATNQNLKQAVEDKKFREDLFFRLNVINIHIPPLRERKEDIPLLVSHFQNKFAAQMNKSITLISPNALSILTGYHWPGNVRELVNTIERAVVFCEKNMITETNLPPDIRGVSDDKSNGADVPVMTLAEIEKKLITKILIETNWNLRRSAKILDIHRGTLYSKIDKHQIRKEDLVLN